MAPEMQWFREARYGAIIHYGLYSLLGRGEWVLNREHIPISEYKQLADEFTAARLDFDEMMRRARSDWGMRYAVLTCKHHDGFCLYDSKLTDFTSVNSRCGRDLVGEFVAACRKHGMRIGLYHSLNDWTTSPNAVDALEQPDGCYPRFMDFIQGQMRELLTNYGAIDVMWYDGWWPYADDGWQAEKLHAMARELQPGILLNGRTGRPGDFDTPERHITPSAEGRAWEAAMTLNDNWGYHRGDHEWKSPKDVAEMLRQGAAGCGNVLINLGPKGDGSLPPESVACLDRVGAWLVKNGEAIFNTDRFLCSLHEREGYDSDFTHSGNFTAAGNAFYWHLRHWPGDPCTLAGVECAVTEVADLATGEIYPFHQQGNRVVVEHVGDDRDTAMPIVLRFRTENQPRLYLCGGYRVPGVDHPRYDPVASDLLGYP